MIPSEIKYDANATPPHWTDNSDQVIEKGTNVRIKIKGVRSEVDRQFAIGTMKEVCSIRLESFSCVMVCNHLPVLRASIIPSRKVSTLNQKLADCSVGLSWPATAIKCFARKRLIVAPDSNCEIFYRSPWKLGLASSRQQHPSDWAVVRGVTP